MPLARVWLPSPCYSGRGGSTVRLIVLHTSEGAQTYQSLANWFANPANNVSSHVGIDDTPGVVGEYVSRGNKAWTAANANPVAVQAELCTPSGAAAGWSYATWKTHQTMLDNAAAWVAEEAAAFGIPIVKLSPAQAQGGGAGVCQHRDLGTWGGNHNDCGDGFPIDEVLAAAAGGAPAPAPAAQSEANMVIQDIHSGGYWVADPTNGAVYAYDGAPWIGATNNMKMNAGGYPCAGIATYDTGYCIVLDFGADGEKDGGDRFRRYRFPRDGSGAA